ncbi:Nitrogen permease regulator 3 [Podosphaera aphanis]|nr:Nitrogen permease regulator 3 [Podosphaera aphanis]
MSSGLVAIALVIRSRDGPRFVFHYPAQPSADISSEDQLFGTDLQSSKLDISQLSDDNDSDPEEGMRNTLNRTFLHDEISDDYNEIRFNYSHLHNWRLNIDDHYETAAGTHIVPWEHLFEFSTTDLESILTPSKAYHKKKFELTLDPLCFISFPIHIREDGLWKKKPKRGKKQNESISNIHQNESTSGNIDAASPKFEDENFKDNDDGGMTMFNIVFILDVPKYNLREKAEEMYDHVAKRLNWALMEAQASTNYVWNESEMILAMKEKAREDRRPMSWLWREILLTSTLASAMKEIFDSISCNKIATFQLGTLPDLSLQIPVPCFLTSLPSPREKGAPGLLAISASPLADDDDNYDQPKLNKHFALLLLDNESKIVSEMLADNNKLSAVLIECIRLCKPTVSFAQIAQAHSVGLSSLLTLASHLIIYRRAMAIPPLHSRNTYIVSPNCDSRNLPRAGVAWRKAFPFAPNLQNFLAALSTTPRPYKTFAPSRDHRPTYLEMLAWLIRGGWVTQLRTFAWIQVWPEIQYEISYYIRAEAIEKAKNKQKRSYDGSSTGLSDDSGSEVYPINSDAPLTTEQVAEQARLQRLADKLAKQAAEEVAAFSRLPIPVATATPSFNNSSHLDSFPAPYIIKDPQKLTYEESLYITAIGKRFMDPKAKKLWSRFTKYFNGNEALESIALQENMKRKETWSILLNYQEHLLVCCRW